MILILLVVCVCCFESEKNISFNIGEKNSDDVTLITAFFDIGRGEKAEFRRFHRTRQKYFDYFSKWAKIRNRLIVFSQNEKDKEEILSIRRNYNLENETSVIVIQNIFNIELDMYNKLVEISNNAQFLDFRLEKDLPENNAEYNYIMYMKVYFLYKASIENEIKTANLAWIDFGFNHGREVYIAEEDWLYTLKCNSSGKINLFFLPPKLEERPLFEVTRTCHSDGVVDRGVATGCFILCPNVLVSAFWTLMKETIYELLYLGLMDDDQPVLLLASRRKPQMFEFKPSMWFLALKNHCNGSHMRIKEKKVHHHHRDVKGVGKVGKVGK